MYKTVPIIIVVLTVYSSRICYGQDTTHESWNLHFQQTVIGQYHPGFRSPYEGVNSLTALEPAAYSVTSTLFLGAKLWSGGELYFDPELAGGSGLSGSTGVAGALNGETYRIGNPA